MNIFKLLNIEAPLDAIDLHMTPADTYGLFECRGDMHRVRSSRERYYYFYIDNWSQPPTLCFMERGIRHARVLALIKAPREMLDNCIRNQGKTYKEKNYAIDEPIRAWLRKNILARIDETKVKPVYFHPDNPLASHELPEIPVHDFRQRKVFLPDQGRIIHESDIAAIIREYDFFESRYNPSGTFQNNLRQTKERGTALDLATGLRWQLAGSDMNSMRQLKHWMNEVNKEKVAGFNDWRLPTIEESLSLLRGERGKHRSYIHPCFETRQGYIYTADRRKPGGYWFVDFRQARVFWASGTFAGGFGRLCRSEWLPDNPCY